MVEAPNQRVAESWASIPLPFSWLWVKIALLDRVVNIKSINATRDSSFANIECLDSKIEQISEESSVCRDGVEGRELDAFVAFHKVVLFEALGLNR